ncbi:uncharacterized protein LOC130682724 isoform X2 [Manis pentadactyla]|uniref:uncharacterized protein LOC130682724 isoform X2 n=1 Tax=Manis pentadactyla TaxID=143292 RepID=UPI00255CA8D3|nr:uncharacterized protein LOC130682724 isoform X2 [Manis pentadactyla]
MACRLVKKQTNPGFYKSKRLEQGTLAVPFVVFHYGSPTRLTHRREEGARREIAAQVGTTDSTCAGWEPPGDVSPTPRRRGAHRSPAAPRGSQGGAGAGQTRAGGRTEAQVSESDNKCSSSRGNSLEGKVEALGLQALHSWLLRPQWREWGSRSGHKGIYFLSLRVRDKAES